MKITILSSTVTTTPTAKGSYQTAEVAYKGEDGQVKGKKIMSFGAAAATFKVLSKAQSGESYDITAVKNEQSGYWDWTNAIKVDSTSGGTTSAPIPATSGNAARSTYETAEERARKQVYIVRQSSLATAVEYVNLNGGGSPQEVIALAKQFEDYVFKTEGIPAAISTFEDDVPL